MGVSRHLSSVMAVDLQHTVKLSTPHNGQESNSQTPT